MANVSKSETKIDSKATRKRPRWVLAGAVLMILAVLYAVGYRSVAPGNRLAEAPHNSAALNEGDKAAKAPFPGRPLPPEQIAPGEAKCEGGNCAGKDSGVGGTAGGSAGDGPAAPSSELAAGIAQRQDRAVTGGPGVSIAPIPVPGPGFGNGQSIVRSGDMEVKIKKGTFSRNWARATAIATKHGGFVAGSSADQVKGQLSRGTITVRIPSKELDAAVADFQALGKVVRLSTSSSDVSSQIVDFDARLRAAQARELQLLELLKQARTVSDSLQVGTSLSEVRTEIESLQGQKASIQNQVDLSTLTVTIYEPQAAPEDPRPIARGQLGQAWNKALDSAETTVSSIVIGAGRLLPLALLGLIVWAVVRFLRRKTLS